MSPALTPEKPRRLVEPGARITCVCGWCVTCKARARKAKQRNLFVNPDWRLWPESYRYIYFHSIARDMLGPDANLQSCLRSRRAEPRVGRNVS